MDLTILAAVLLLAGCSRNASDAPALDTFPVRLEAASRRDLEQTLSLVGSLKAKDEATLFSRVPGKLLKNVVDEGDPIKKGEAVALVERDEVGVRFEPAPVPSTLDGVVGRIYLDRGANVSPAIPIALVVDQSQVLARAEVPERYAAVAGLNTPVEVQVEAYPDKTFTGRISRVSPVMDPSTRSTPIEVRIENRSGTLKSGMFAKLSIMIAKKENAVSVPAEAVVNGSGPAVFVVADGKKATKHEVTLGVRTDKYVEIASGLSEGDKVVTFGLFGLQDGSPVQVLEDR
ncbi:MAG: efflux RND transporter periplasmic adaptor subunit [Elusimicrobiota bacterium]